MIYEITNNNDNNSNGMVVMSFMMTGPDGVTKQSHFGIETTKWNAMSVDERVDFLRTGVRNIISETTDMII